MIFNYCNKLCNSHSKHLYFVLFIKIFIFKILKNTLSLTHYHLKLSFKIKNALNFESNKNKVKILELNELNKKV